MHWLEILRLGVRLTGSVAGCWYLFIAHGLLYQRDVFDQPNMGRAGRGRVLRWRIVACAFFCIILLLAIWL